MRWAIRWNLGRRVARIAVAAAAAAAPCAAAVAAPAPEEAQPSLSTHDPACPADHAGPSVLVRVTGFKDRAGQLRVELYPGTAEDFLSPGRALRAAGKVFQRIDIPTPPEGDGEVCVALPAPGIYAVAVLHDRNTDGRLNPFSDGYGFPNNPRLGYGKPDVADVAFTAGEGRLALDVVLNYWNGFSARPLRR